MIKKEKIGLNFSIPKIKGLIYQYFDFDLDDMEVGETEDIIRSNIIMDDVGGIVGDSVVGLEVKKQTDDILYIDSIYLEVDGDPNDILFSTVEYEDDKKVTYPTTISDWIDTHWDAEMQQVFMWDIIASKNYVDFYADKVTLEDYDGEKWYRLDRRDHVKFKTYDDLINVGLEMAAKYLYPYILEKEVPGYVIKAFIKSEHEEHNPIFTISIKGTLEWK